MTEYKPTDRPHLRLRDFPAGETPRERLQQVGQQGLSTTELLAIVIGSGHGTNNVLQLAQLLLCDLDGLPGLTRASTQELQQVKGIGEAKAAQVKAALELGRRAVTLPFEERQVVRSPDEAAQLLMPDMAALEQEHLRVVLLDTRNRVLSTPTVYIGSLNSNIVRIGELFRTGIRENAAAMIVAHNHPSGDPSPSPEDVRVTRQIAEAGKLLGIEVLDHIVIGHQRYISMKGRGLGFD